MSELAQVSVTVYGHVQGVFYRAFTTRIAKSLDLKGYVRNMSSSKAVEIIAEGRKENLEDLIKKLEAGPPEALVDKIDTTWSEFTGQFVNFDSRL